MRWRGVPKRVQVELHPNGLTFMEMDKPPGEVVVPGAQPDVKRLTRARAKEVLLKAGYTFGNDVIDDLREE